MIGIRSTRRFVAVLAVSIIAAACGDAVGPVTFDAPIDLGAEWRTASSEAVGANGAALDHAADQAGAIPRMRSLVVVRRGRIVLERYFHGATSEDLEDVRSVTKSVVSTLTGIALERGYLESLDQTLEELLPETVGMLQPWERGITVRNLLTMSGGWTWFENGPVGYNDWIASGDPVGYLLAKPEASAPGSAFEYNSAAVNLLGVVLEKATGRKLPAFADQVLLAPIGVGSRAWEALGNGVNGGAGLKLRPRDLARIGQLFLQDGWSGTHRVLPAGWVAEATARHYTWLNEVGPSHLSYGYLWWTDEDHHAYMAWGYGGQFIYVAPERDLVVVATTNWWLLGGQSVPPALAAQVLGVIVDGVLPAAPPE